MSEIHYHQEFITTLQQKIPQRAALVNTISDILGIDKDAIYRRLHGKAGFSFAEIALIARRLGISLDVIAGIDTAQCKSIRLAYTKHIDPSEVDYVMFDEYINALKFIKDEPETRIIDGGNLIPTYLYFDYEYITRLYMLNWSQNSHFGRRIPFHEVIIPDRMRTSQIQSCYYARHIKSTTYVWDSRIFEQFVSTVKFYANVRLINAEDVAMIKNELITLLNVIEEIAVTGKYKDTGNEVLIYAGDIHADSNFGYIESKNMRISQYKAFVFNAFSSFESLFANEIISWLQAAQRLTTLISVSGEKTRIDFFNAQREIIDSL